MPSIAVLVWVEQVSKPLNVVAHYTTSRFTFSFFPTPGMVIACYLVAEEGFAAHEAIQLVREKRPHSLVCSKQELAVHRFAAYLDELR